MSERLQALADDSNQKLEAAWAVILEKLTLAARDRAEAQDRDGLQKLRQLAKGYQSQVELWSSTLRNRTSSRIAALGFAFGQLADMLGECLAGEMPEQQDAAGEEGEEWKNLD